MSLLALTSPASPPAPARDRSAPEASPASGPSGGRAGGPWIVSARQDLLWFHGSVLAGLLLLAVFAWAPKLSNASYASGHPAVLALLLWGVLFDGTHVWGTYARSYLVADPTARRGLPGRWSLALLLAGPVLAVLDAGLPQRPSVLGHAGWLFQNFLLVAYLWAYWHLVRQHYGFLVLYQRRAPGRRPLDARLAVALLWVGCLYPYLRFSLSPAYLRSGLPLVLPEAWLPQLRLALDGGAAVVLGALGLALVLRLRRVRPGPPELLLFIVIGFTALVFATLDNLLTITAVLTIFHNLQYHRIVWQYERGRGRIPSGSLARYLGFGMLLGLFWYGPRILGVAMVPAGLCRNVLLGLGWGVALHHYFIDGRIWRVRRHTEVAQALDAGAAASQP
jgi:hypothetical protein